VRITWREKAAYILIRGIYEGKGASVGNLKLGRNNWKAVSHPAGTSEKVASRNKLPSGS
jgi:hypothetical protein